MALIHKRTQLENREMLRLALQSKYSTMPEAFQKVADYLLAYPDDVIYMNISTLAEKADVSDATITKFVRSIGFTSFQNLKITLARSSRPSSDIEPDFLEDNIDLVQRVFLHNIQRLQDMLIMLDIDKIHKFAESIYTARKLVIYGVANSAVVADYLRIRMLSLGLDAYTYCDPLEQALSAKNVGDEDVVMGICLSDLYTQNMAALLRTAKENGARTICIADQESTAIQEYADDVIVTASSSATTGEQDSAQTHIAEICTVDALYEVLHQIHMIHQNNSKQ